MTELYTKKSHSSKATWCQGKNIRFGHYCILPFSQLSLVRVDGLIVLGGGQAGPFQSPQAFLHWRLTEVTGAAGRLVNH